MKKTTLSAIFFSIAMSCIVIATAMAASPWQWEMSLQGTRGRDVMSNPTAIYIDPQLERYYVVDAGNNRLLSYNRIGELLSEFTGGGQLKDPKKLPQRQSLLKDRRFTLTDWRLKMIRSICLIELEVLSSVLTGTWR
jgi:hypothetical protein